MLVLEKQVWKWLSNFAWISKLERLTTPLSFPRGAFVTLLVKIRVLFEFATRRIIRTIHGQAALNSLKKMKGVGQGKNAMVVASGPSLAGLKVAEVSRLRTAGKLELFAVNSSGKASAVVQTGFDYLVVSDPGHDMPLDKLFQECLPEDTKSALKGIFAPRHFTCAKDDESGLVVAFEDVPAPFRIGRGINPSKSRKYLSLTALKALAIADYMGFDQIFVLGLDSSLFLNVSVSRGNELFQGARHFKGSTTKESNIDYLYPNGLSDYFFTTGRYFFEVRKYFSGRKFVNLDPNSFLDSLPKADPLGATTLWHDKSELED